MSQNQPQDDASRYPDVLIEDHEYDGIKEYDNPMPGWWLWIFYAKIAWSVFYIAALGVGWIDDYDAQLERGQQHVAELRSAHEGSAVAIDVDEEYLQGLLEDDAAIDLGQQTYQSRCSACHGMDGEGGIGPAFDDGQWIHGDEMMDQYRHTRDGLPAGGMPAHENMLSAEQLAAVTAFINSF